MAHDMESDGGDVEVENDGSPLEHHLSNLLLELGKFQLLLDTKGQPLDAQGVMTRRARAWFKQASDVHPGGRLFVRSAFCADCETSIRQLGDDNDDAGNTGPAPPRSESVEGQEEGVTDDSSTGSSSDGGSSGGPKAAVEDDYTGFRITRENQNGSFSGKLFSFAKSDPSLSWQIIDFCSNQETLNSPTSKPFPRFPQPAGLRRCCTSAT